MPVAGERLDPAFPPAGAIFFILPDTRPLWQELIPHCYLTSIAHGSNV